MYRVGILEDGISDSNIVKRVCRNVLGGLKAHFQVLHYASGERFLAEAAGALDSFDLMLVDILMEGVNGFEIARHVREARKDTSIIFITQSKDFLEESFDVRPLHYLVKPVEEEKLARLISEDYMERYRQEYYVFESPLVKTKAHIEDVVYLEINSRKIAVHLEDQTVYHAGKLTDLLAALPEGCFARTHQGYAVNISRVIEVSRKGVLMDNGMSVPVSRAFYNQVKASFVERHLGI